MQLTNVYFISNQFKPIIMKKNFTLLLMLIASLLFSTNVMAQFKYDITEEVKPDYATTNVEFSLAEVAAQLECSVEDLVAALDEWESSGYPETTIFALENPDGTVSTTHSADYGGYYMNLKSASNLNCSKELEHYAS